MEEDVVPVNSIEAERRYYGNRWDKVITLLIEPSDSASLKDYNITLEQAKKLAEDLNELIAVEKNVV